VYSTFADPSPSFRLHLRLRLHFVALFSGAARSVNRAALHPLLVPVGTSASALDVLTEDKTGRSTFLTREGVEASRRKVFD
jgi:hypothetical protein